MDTQLRTNLQILTRYQEPLKGSRKPLTCKTEVAFSGVPLKTIDDREICGVLLIALGCFEVVLGAKESEPDVDYPNCVVVHTATRQVFATALALEEVRGVLRVAVQSYADRAGIPEISEAVTQALISEAVQVLNADPVKLNALGGAA
jgi:hypothetical protein